MCRDCGEREVTRPKRRKCPVCSSSPHTCSIEGCDHRRYSRQTGYCRGHHRAWQRTGDPLKRRKYVLSDGSCRWPNCPKPHRRNGFCVNHSATHYRMLESTVAQPKVPQVPADPIVEHFESLRRRGWSANDIADELGMTRRTVQRWLAREETLMQRAAAEDICDALGLHPAMLWSEWVICKHGHTECERCGLKAVALGNFMRR